MDLNIVTKQTFLTALGAALAATALTPSAHASCGRTYDLISEETHQVVQKYGDVVLQEDWIRKRKNLSDKIFRDSVVPGVGLVFDLITEPHDAYVSHEVKESEGVDETIRERAIEIWEDQLLVSNILRDSFVNATENPAFQTLYTDIEEDLPTFAMTEDQLAAVINAANWSEHFCIEHPMPVFVRNRFGKMYETGIRVLTPYERIKLSIENGGWNKFLPGEAQSLDQQYQTTPATPNPTVVYPDQPHYPRNPLDDLPSNPYPYSR